MMLLRAWERMCNVFSVGYQALKLYGPAHPDFDWISTDCRALGLDFAEGWDGVMDGMKEDEALQCHAAEHCPSSFGCKMHIDEL